METEEHVMKTLLIAALASLALGGCVAVPVYDAGYGPAYGPPAVVVRPYVYGGYSNYGGRGYYGGPYRRY